MTGISTQRDVGGAAAARKISLLSRLVPATIAYWLVSCIAYLLMVLPNATDLIGPDNDDRMRLVEVRDLLNGQGWFDLMQYRLGLEGGTLMHWSRLVDLPIATLIRGFALFLPMQAAEGAAAVTWPLLLAGLLLLPLGLAGRRMGGIVTMHIALGLGVMFVLGCNKFKPGAIDHHNVQLVLVMWIVAMLLDRDYRPISFAIAGIAAALAIAVGAEPVPLVAVICAGVALQWIWFGADYAAGARAFGLSLALAVSACFFLTVPPQAYAVVTCDSLSLGFYALTAIGGAGLFFAASMPGMTARGSRTVVAIVLGAVILVSARLIAPQCLGNPLANLDPLLVDLWLNGVSEARSLPSELGYSPATFGAFYAVGFFAMAVCVFRMIEGRERAIHALLLLLIAAAWGVSAVQVRGAIFANLLSILPLSLVITDLRRAARVSPESPAVALAFICGALMSVPAVWGVAGILAEKGFGGLSMNAIAGGGENADAGMQCGGPQTWALLNSLPPGVVAASSNTGADILRYTPHRVLTAPYHRNQGGMLTELHIGLATPSDAEAFLRGAGVTALLFCKHDPQTQAMAEIRKDGLYAHLARGDVPAYLAPMSEAVMEGVRVFRFQP